MTKTLSHPAHVGSVPQRVPRIGVSLRRVIIAVLIVSVAGAAALVVGGFGSESVAPADELTVGQAADAARWTAMAQSTAGSLTQGQLADAARWTAMAQSTAGSLTQGQLADAARLTAQAESLGVVGDGLTRGQRADAARLEAIARANE